MLNVDTTRSRPSAADVLTPLWRTQVADLRAREADVRLGHPDAVHRFRVAARRLRSNLAGLRPLLDGTLSNGLERDLQETASAVSAARDVDVVQGRIDLLLQDEAPGPEVDRTRDRLSRLLAAASRDSRQRSVDYLDSPTYDALTRGLDRFSDIPPWSPSADLPAEEALRPLLRKEWTRFRNRGRRALAPDPGIGAGQDDLLHEARKAAKRVRYLADSLVPVFGRKAKQLSKAAGRVQVVLGEHQDSVITRALLDEAAALALRDGDETSVITRMRTREALTAAELRTEFVRVFGEADRKSLRRWLS
jgi:CHAD domain-containing protein